MTTASGSHINRNRCDKRGRELSAELVGTAGVLRPEPLPEPLGTALTGKGGGFPHL